jgi:hypothetical protein
MKKTAGRILKSNDVKLEGRFLLDVTKGGLGSPKRGITAVTEPQARVLENHPQYALIEVTCSCGTKISLKCDYAGATAPAPEDPQT